MEAVEVEVTVLVAVAFTLTVTGEVVELVDEDDNPEITKKNLEYYGTFVHL